VSVYIGIDPGLGGALAVLNPVIAPPLVFDTPTLKVGKRTEYNVSEMRMFLHRLSGRMSIFCAIERVHSMPRQGVASSFKFGYGLGLWIGILAAEGIPYELVTPQRWKGALLDGTTKDKGASRLKALQLFPALADQLGRQKDHGRAEALLLAEFGRRISSGR